MAKQVLLKQETTGITKVADVGASVGVFFLGPIWPLIKGDFKWAGIIVLTYIALWLFFGDNGIIKVSTFVFQGIAMACALVFCMTYNKSRIRALLSEGWVPANEASSELLKMNGF